MDTRLVAEWATLVKLSYFLTYFNTYPPMLKPVLIQVAWALNFAREWRLTRMLRLLLQNKFGNALPFRNLQQPNLLQDRFEGGGGGGWGGGGGVKRETLPFN